MKYHNDDKHTAVLRMVMLFCLLVFTLLMCSCIDMNYNDPQGRPYVITSAVKYSNTTSEFTATYKGLEWMNTSEGRIEFRDLHTKFQIGDTIEIINVSRHVSK